MTYQAHDKVTKGCRKGVDTMLLIYIQTMVISDKMLMLAKNLSH